MPWDLLKEINEAWWRWQRHEEEPVESRQGAIVITDYEVRAVRALYALGDRTQASLGAMFGVHQTTVSDIVNRKRRYADIT